MAAIDDLRDEYRRKRAAATRKVARNERLGINLSGSSLDPRKDRGAERSMNSRKLRSELRKLDAFISRRNQYVRGKDGAPLPRSDFKSYKRAEAKVGNLAEAELNRLRGVKLYDGSTIGDRESMLQTQMANGPTNRTYTKRNRGPAGITSLKAMRQLIDKENDKLNPGYRAKAIRSAKLSAIKMYEAMGDGESARRIESMHNERFYIAWNYGGLADETSLKYNSPSIDGFDPDEGSDWEADDDVNAPVYRQIMNWAERINLDDYKETKSQGQSRRKR